MLNHFIEKNTWVTQFCLSTNNSLHVDRFPQSKSAKHFRSFVQVIKVILFFHPLHDIERRQLHNHLLSAHQTTQKHIRRLGAREEKVAQPKEFPLRNILRQVVKIVILPSSVVHHHIRTAPVGLSGKIRLAWTYGMCVFCLAHSTWMKESKETVRSTQYTQEFAWTRGKYGRTVRSEGT